MPSFLYVGDPGRVYLDPDGTVVRNPGDVVEADVNPDPDRFDEVGADGEPPIVVDPPAEPSVDEPAQEG